MSTIQGACTMHGEGQLHVWSDICSAFICIECVKENLFTEAVEKEIVEKYPNAFGDKNETSSK